MRKGKVSGSGGVGPSGRGGPEIPKEDAEVALYNGGRQMKRLKGGKGKRRMSRSPQGVPGKPGRARRRLESSAGFAEGELRTGMPFHGNRVEFDSASGRWLLMFEDRLKLFEEMPEASGSFGAEVYSMAEYAFGEVADAANVDEFNVALDLVDILMLKLDEAEDEEVRVLVKACLMKVMGNLDLVCGVVDEGVIERILIEGYDEGLSQEYFEGVGVLGDHVVFLCGIGDDESFEYAEGLFGAMMVCLEGQAGEVLREIDGVEALYEMQWGKVVDCAKKPELFEKVMGLMQVRKALRG